jgi:hypothetical protein
MALTSFRWACCLADRNPEVGLVLPLRSQRGADLLKGLEVLDQVRLFLGEHAPRPYLFQAQFQRALWRSVN